MHVNSKSWAGPRPVYRAVAIAEAITWAGLLVGMFVKYVVRWTDLGVTIFGPIHGMAFIAFCLTTVLIGIDQQWRPVRVLLGLLSAIPPFTTVLFEWLVDRSGGLGPHWRLATERPSNPIEGAVGWLVRRSARGALIGLALVGVLTIVAMLIGGVAG